MGKWWNESYNKREPITIDFSTVGTLPVSHDIEILIPDDWDLFWDNTRSDGKDIVLTDASGAVLNFQFKTGFNLANRILTLQIKALPVNQINSMQQVFLYFDFTTESIDYKSTFTVSTPKNGFVFLGSPNQRVVFPINNVPVSTAPTISFIKQSTETIDIFFSIKNLLEERLDIFNGKFKFEEVENVFVKSLDKDGIDSSARYDLIETRFLKEFIMARSKAGSSGDGYAFGIEITTTTKQIYDIRCLVKVQNLLPN